MTNFEIGDRVTHLCKSTWGFGQVLSKKDGDKVSIFFTKVGKKNLDLKYAKLQLANGAAANSYILNNLYIPPKNTATFRNISDSIVLFLNRYPKGFYDSQYLKDERNYKYATHIYAAKLLSKKNLSMLLNKQDYSEICSRAKNIITYKPQGTHKMNMFHPIGELIPFQDVLKEVKNHESYAISLFDLLYGEDTLEERFNRFCDMLASLKIDNWPLTTFFLYIMFPDQYMIIRPRPTKGAAELCGIDIMYKSETNFQTFNRVIEFSNYLKNELSQLKPRDMIDIQSFMWCIRLLKGQR